MSAVMIGIEGSELLPHEIKYIRNPLCAGVVLFARNYKNPKQLRELCTQIHSISPSALIAADHEGGRVQRFSEFLTRLPKAAALGKLFDLRPITAFGLTEACGLVTAYELRLCDLDLSFTPVLDLRDERSEVIGDRAYHANPAVVSELAMALRRGMISVGMAAVGKHYPGHGRIVGDSHQMLPVDGRTAAQRSPDLYPFLRHIDNNIEGIMCAHIVLQHYDEKPITFSALLIAQLRALGFNGAIISDDLDMEAANIYGNAIQKVAAVFAAGIDVAIICNNFADIEQIMAHPFPPRSHEIEQRLLRLRARPIDLRIHRERYEIARDTIRAAKLTD